MPVCRSRVPVNLTLLHDSESKGWVGAFEAEGALQKRMGGDYCPGVKNS